tara:strand:- start:3060 stop:3572 length:513 start_codon:yes stop_codon:yes gene_type:complete
MSDVVAATGLRFKELGNFRAAKLGCLSAVQRLQRGGRLKHQESLCQAAARSGLLEELKVLCSNGTPWNVWTCAYAARGGHLEVLQWLRTKGCPWDEWTCEQAAQGGHLEVMQWAHANGCPWDGGTIDAAKNADHDNILNWAIANGCPEEYLYDDQSNSSMFASQSDSDSD